MALVSANYTSHRILLLHLQTAEVVRLMYDIEYFENSHLNGPNNTITSKTCKNYVIYQIVNCLEPISNTFRVLYVNYFAHNIHFFGYEMLP